MTSGPPIAISLEKNKDLASNLPCVFNRSGSPLLGLTVRPQKPHTVEVNEVGRRIGDPNLGLPRDFPKVTTHDCSIRKGSHIDQTSSGVSEEVGEFGVTLAIDRPVASN